MIARSPSTHGNNNRSALQRLLRRRHGGRHRQMIAVRPEAILIGHIVHRIRSAIVRHECVRALLHQHAVGAVGRRLEGALLDHRAAVTGQIAVRILADLVADLGALQQRKGAARIADRCRHGGGNELIDRGGDDFGGSRCRVENVEGGLGVGAAEECDGSDGGGDDEGNGGVEDDLNTKRWGEDRFRQASSKSLIVCLKLANFMMEIVMDGIFNDDVCRCTDACCCCACVIYTINRNCPKYYRCETGTTQKPVHRCTV